MPVFVVVEAARELHKTTALEPRAVARLAVAQALHAAVVGTERRTAGFGVELRGEFGNGQKTFALGPDGSEGGANHGGVDQAHCTQGSGHVGQVAAHVGGFGGREELAHGVQAQRQSHCRWLPQPEHLQGARPHHTIGNQTHAGLPAANCGLNGVVEHIT